MGNAVTQKGHTARKRGWFCYAVEVEMIITMLSELTNVPPEVIEEYRKEAIRNVRRTRGKINLDDLISKNNREFAEQKISAKSVVCDAIIDEFTTEDYDFMEEDI